jgi:hypothetical protein
MAKQRSLDVFAQQEIIDDVIRQLVAAAPQGWQRIWVEFLAVVQMKTSIMEVTGPDGVVVRKAPPSGVVDRLDDLRWAMYADGTGTWFSALVTIAPDNYDISYDYDAEPSIFPPPGAGMFATDLRYFPRAPEKVPDWLRLKVSEAQS